MPETPAPLPPEGGPPPGRFRFDLRPPSAPAGVSIARRLLRDSLRALGRDDWAACLVLSELLTNAVRHGGVPSVLMELEAGRLLITVSDSSAVLPRRREPEREGEGGRGLGLVADLAVAWGVEPMGRYGKAVWAEVAA
ncbi:ATP-binding protein [Kitasatospora cineracea]|uniref:ATP-binding protein n=1 Tax=Kitasatospora cineracea TaxID=88074 RepID=UPI00343CF580